MNELENLKKKILYRSSYRGTKEMDILLSSFVKFYINKLTKLELKNLNNLLEKEDEVIYNFYYNRKTDVLKENNITILLKKFKI
tara:strand:- start:48 stop:299 length:252 start_codon:yes stop_codon:yes gene_type:complete